MSKAVTPSMQAIKTPEGLLRTMKSSAKTLAGNLTYGTPTGSKDATGVFNSFQTDNINNGIFRVGANGTTDNKYAWDGSGNVTIAHGLSRQPIGFKLLDKDKTCDVYRTGGAPTDTLITLTCTDKTANVTVEIF